MIGIGMLTVVKATLLMLVVVPFIVISVVLYQRYSSSLSVICVNGFSHLNAKIAEVLEVMLFQNLPRRSV